MLQNTTPSLPLNETAGQPWDPPFTGWIFNFGRFLLRGLATIQGLGALGLITLSVLLRKSQKARAIIRPQMRAQLTRSIFEVAPMVFFLALVLGFLVIGQAVKFFNQVGANDWVGTLMVTVVVRELGPLLTAILVLARTGTAFVIELATARAQGEVEALEVLGIDPVLYLVVPRVVGLSLGIFSLTVYLILITLVSGYFWAFLHNVPLTPGDYFRQLASSLDSLDFVVLGLKTTLYGAGIAVVTCYHGLAQPLALADVSRVAVRAVAQGVGLCIAIDALFLIPYFFLF